MSSHFGVSLTAVASSSTSEELEAQAGMPGETQEGHTKGASVSGRLKADWAVLPLEGFGLGLVLVDRTQNCPQPSTGRCLAASQVPHRAGAPAPGRRSLKSGVLIVQLPLSAGPLPTASGAVSVQAARGIIVVFMR